MTATKRMNPKNWPVGKQYQVPYHVETWQCLRKSTFWIILSPLSWILVAYSLSVNFQYNWVWYPIHLILLNPLQVFYFNTGDPELLKEKLLSIPDHISNLHKFDQNKKYTACPHPPLIGDRAKAWLPVGSLVSKPPTKIKSLMHAQRHN